MDRPLVPACAHFFVGHRASVSSTSLWLWSGRWAQTQAQNHQRARGPMAAPADEEDRATAPQDDAGSGAAVSPVSGRLSGQSGMRLGNFGWVSTKCGLLSANFGRLRPHAHQYRPMSGPRMIAVLQRLPPASIRRRARSAMAKCCSAGLWSVSAAHFVVRWAEHVDRERWPRSHWPAQRARWQAAEWCAAQRRLAGSVALSAGRIDTRAERGCVALR